jgi:hypothetical protein
MANGMRNLLSAKHAAIAIAAFTAGAGLAVHSVGSLPLEQQSAPAATELATRLAASVDTFRSGG